MSISNRYSYQTRYLNSIPSKQNAIPLYLRMPNSSAEVVLRERKVEIKDLESRISYLQNQIKDLKIENKTLKDVQGRHEKELKKFKEGVADIPSLLRSHKEEVKALEAKSSSLRRELRDCQKELKSKSDIILKKDQQIEKINSVCKRHEKHLQEVNFENKEIKIEKKKLDEECKKLLAGNEELKSKNERLQRKVQQMNNMILSLEESLGTAEHHKAQLKDDLTKLQKSNEELQQNFTLLKSHPPLLSSGTQTENLNNSSTLRNLAPEDSKTFHQVKEEINVGALMYSQNDYIEQKNDCRTEEKQIVKDQNNVMSKNFTDIPNMHFPNSSLSFRTEAKEQKPFLLEPMRPRLPFTMRAIDHSVIANDTTNDEKQYFSFNNSYLLSNIFESQCSLKNTDLSTKSNEKKSPKKQVMKICSNISVANDSDYDVSNCVDYDYSFYNCKANDTAEKI